MSMLNLKLGKMNSAFLSVCQASQRTLFTNATPNYLKVTGVLCAEPLKKKKKMDPAIIKAREDRKRRRLEKEIRKLEKSAAQFKPLDELEVPRPLLQDIENRKRPDVEHDEGELNRRYKLEKMWSQYKFNQHNEDFAMISKVLKAKENALEELRMESEELYHEAIQVDLNLIPFKCKGPLDTPPIDGFEAIDGDYVDTTRVWE